LVVVGQATQLEDFQVAAVLVVMLKVQVLHFLLQVLL
jgi:hypothetical protein